MASLLLPGKGLVPKNLEMESHSFNKRKRRGTIANSRKSLFRIRM